MAAQMNEFFIQKLRRAAWETKRICERGHHKLTDSSREERVQRVGHFCTCLRREIHGIGEGFKELTDFLVDKTNWYDVLELERNKKYMPATLVLRNPNLHSKIIPGSYAAISVDTVRSWIEQAKSTMHTFEDINDSITYNLEELAEIVMQTQSCIDGAVSINNQSVQVLENLAKILEEV